MQRLGAGALLILHCTVYVAGCGVDFKIADQPKPKDPAYRDDVTIEAPDAVLAVNDGGEAVALNSLASPNVTLLKGRFLHTATETLRLSLGRPEVKRKKCGDDDSVNPTFVWRDVTPLAEGETPTPDVQLTPLVPFLATQGRSYALLVEMKTSFGQCATMSVNFGVRALR